MDFFHINLFPEIALIMLESKDEVGIGIAEFLFEDRLSYGNTGSIDDFRSMFGHFPEEYLSFIIISIGSTINLNDTVVAVLNILFHIPFV